VENLRHNNALGACVNPVPKGTKEGAGGFSARFRQKILGENEKIIFDICFARHRKQGVPSWPEMEKIGYWRGEAGSLGKQHIKCFCIVDRKLPCWYSGSGRMKRQIASEGLFERYTRRPHV
jgi:hypothetical protein